MFSQHIGDDHSAIATSIESDLAQRLFEGAAQDIHTRLLIACLDFYVVQHVNGMHQHGTTTGYDTLFDGGACRGERILDAVLLLFEFHLGRRANLDNGYAAGQFCQPLLQLLAVVVAGRLFDLGANLSHARLDGFLLASALDDGSSILVGADCARAAKIAQRGVLKFEASLLRDDLCACQDSDIFQHGLAAITEAGSLDRQHVERAAQLVDHQRGQRLAIYVLSDNHHVLAPGLQHTLQHGQDVRDSADLLIGDEDVWVGELRLHAFHIGRHVGGEVAAIKLHTLGILFFHRQPAALFNGNHTVFADLLHHLGDQFANLAISSGNRGHLGDLLPGLDRHAHRLDLFDDRLGAFFQSFAQDHGVRARRQVLQPLGDNGLRQYRRGGRAIPGHLVSLGRHLFEQLRAHVLKGIRQIDIARNGHTIVGDGGCAILLIQHDVAALWPQRHFNSAGQHIHTLFQGLPRLLIKLQSFCHVIYSYYSTIPIMSLSRRIKYSSPSCFTSVPAYFAKSTFCPTLTSSAVRLPLSSTLPGPTARISPSWGFSLAVSGSTMPLLVTVS